MCTRLSSPVIARMDKSTVSAVPKTIMVTSRVWERRGSGRAARIFAIVATAVFVADGTLPGTAVKPVSALQCFSCTDCSIGGALFAQKQQCGSSEMFCAAVHKQKRFGSMGHSSVDRGCASSLNVACTSDGETVVEADAGTGGSISSYQCCSADLCNGSGEARTEGYRRSEEHLRNLMEGNPRRAARVSSDGEGGAGAGEEGADGDDDNSAQSSRRRGSRLATVLVIVGTFSQVLWLAGSLMQ